MSFESEFEQRVSPAEASEMLRVLGDDFGPIRSSLIKYGLELTLAGELMSCSPNHCERNAASSATRCLAITRLSALLSCTGVELPQNSEELAAEWRQERFENDIESVA